MTAPRTARPYAPRWYEPRHGVRAALKCWAVAAMTVAAVAACHSRASGETADASASPALSVPGLDVACHAVPTITGLRSAGHCLAGGRFTLGGAHYPYSVDGLRDLGHILAPAYARDAHERAPVMGEAVEWRNTRGVGTGHAAEVWWATGTSGAGGELSRVPPGGSDWYPVLTFCHDGGRRVIKGDSGTGIVATSDGALLAVVTRASLGPGADAQGPCAGNQWVIGVPVP